MTGQLLTAEHRANDGAHCPFGHRTPPLRQEVEDEHEESDDWQVPSAHNTGVDAGQPVVAGQLELIDTHEPSKHFTGVVAAQPLAAPLGNMYAARDATLIPAVLTLQLREQVPSRHFCQPRGQPRLSCTPAVSPSRVASSMQLASGVVLDSRYVASDDTSGATHRPDWHRSGLSAGQVLTVAQAPDMRQLPSPQRTVPLAQGRTTGHWLPKATHEASAHRKGVLAAQALMDDGTRGKSGQDDFVTAQYPSAQR